MKRLILIAALSASTTFAAKREQLLPYFLNLVDQKYTTGQSGFTHYIGKSNYGGQEKATAYINEALPETSGVIIDENDFGNRKVVTYSTTMDNGDISVIYFINENGTFSIEYAEGSFTALLPFYQ